MVRLPVILGFLCAWSLALGQEPATSATAVMAMPADTVKVLKLSDLCFAYRRVDADSALFFGHTAMALARSLKYPRGEAQACNDLAIIHMDRSEYASADSLLRAALAIRTLLKDSAGIGAIHNKLGNVFQSQFRLEEALEENYKALRIFERIGPPAKEALILNNIAILQFNLRRYPEALATHRAGAAVRARIGDGQGLAESQGNMANVEVVLGDTASALKHFNEASNYFRAHGLMRELAIQLHNEAGVHMARNEVDRAMTLYSEALSIREKAGEKKAIASTLTGLADAYLRKGRLKEARSALYRSLRLSEEVGARNERMQALLNLSKLHARLNDGDSTYWYHAQYSMLRDSVFNADMNSRLAEMETRYGVAQKEREIQQQRGDLIAKDLELAELGRLAERRRFWSAVSLGVIGLVLLGSLLILQVQRRRSKEASDKALIEERERGLKAVVEGADLERGRIARELHDGVGQQITGLKFRLEDIASRLPEQAPENERVREALVIVSETGREVRDIAHSMMPRALAMLGLAPTLDDMLRKSFGRSGIACVFEHFGMEARLSPDVEVGVYRIAQELTSNVLKHARAGNVSVQLMRSREHVVLIVEDDGTGFGPGVNGAADQGMGLDSIRERARVMNGTVHIESAPGKGTVTTLRVPVGGSTLST